MLSRFCLGFFFLVLHANVPSSGSISTLKAKSKNNAYLRGLPSIGTAMRPESTFHRNLSYGANDTVANGKKGNAVLPVQNKRSLPPPAVTLPEEPCVELPLLEDDCEEIVLKEEVECEEIVLKADPLEGGSIGGGALRTDELILKDKVTDQNMKIVPSTNVTNVTNVSSVSNNTTIQKVVTNTSITNPASAKKTQEPDSATDNVDTFASDLLNFGS